jgi:cytochrome P450
VAIREAGGDLSEDELLEIGGVLMVAGHETTVNALGNTVIALHRHPDQLAALRADPDLAPSAAEEGLRYDSPIQFTARVAMKEQVLAGRTFMRGDGVVLMIGSANRDPEAFEDPDRFDITRYHGREPAARHLAFSMGAHHCLGVQLARMEMDVALRALVRQAPQMTVLTDEPVYRNLFLFRGPEHLPVRLHP